MTISLPPAMIKKVEQVRKAEDRTRSELVREALRRYFEESSPVVAGTDAEMAAIRRGRAQIRRGQFVTLHQLLVRPSRRPRKKST
jgi:predicted transcriptional regulator